MRHIDPRFRLTAAAVLDPNASVNSRLVDSPDRLPDTEPSPPRPDSAGDV